MTTLLYVSAGGLAGTLARFLLQGWIQPRHSAFPLGTLVINIAGSLALGFIIRYTTATTVASPELRAGLTIGFCGAFTTMSTFSYESMALLGDGEYVRASIYMGGTVVGCLAAVVVGTLLAERML